MIGILLLCAYLICGIAIANSLFAAKSVLVRLWLGLCAGLMLMMWLPAIFAFWLNFTRLANLLGLLAALVLALGCLITGRRRARRSPLPDRSAPRPFCGEIPLWLVLALLLPALALSAYLQYTHTLRAVDGALHVGQSTYGDLCLHLGIATGLRNAPFPPDYTLLPGTLLGYPFLADGMVTSMLLFGSGLSFSFVLTGTLMMALVYLGFIIFAWELTRKPCAVVLAFVLLFFNGGLGFLYVFDGVFKDPSALMRVFTGYYATPTNLVDLNLCWVNLVCDMLVPQRTFLAGWAMLLPALYMLIDAARARRARNWALLGVWAGLMPMVHTHSFFALGLASFGLALHGLVRADANERRTRLGHYALYALCALALALPQLLTWTFPQTIGGGSLSLRFNWVNNRGDGRLIDGYFWFWIKNVGLCYLLLAPAALSAPRRSLRRGLAAGALVIYIAAETVQFQPNPYDNNKLFYAAYLILLPLVARYLVRVWQRLRGVRGRALLACVFVGACTLSGALSIARELVSDYELFSAAEVRAAAYIDENLPADAVFLTGQQHNNPVAALAGRHIVCGTDSYLYYHGVDYLTQQQAMLDMLARPGESAALFEQYEVSYVYISSEERYAYGADENWFAQNCYLIYDLGGVRIYARTPEDAVRAQAVLADAVELPSPVAVDEDDAKLPSPTAADARASFDEAVRAWSATDAAALARPTPKA